MTNLIRLAAIIATATAIYFIATAPALWWMPEAEKAALIAQAEAQHGQAAADYLRTITR